MKTEVKVLLLGFAPFEKATFESFFKLVGRRDTLYTIVPDVAQAQVLMVNSDNPTAVQWANASVSSPQKALFIGAADPSGKWPAAPRPIKLTTVLGLLDVLTMADKSAAQHQPAPPRAEAMVMAPPAAVPAAVNKPVQPAPIKGSVRQGSGSRSRSDFGASNFIGLGSAPQPVSAAQQYDDILVVDDSDIALKFMQNRLTRYGFRAELAKSGEEALTRVATDSYKFVFLDVMMEGLDGYQTCRAIKQRKYTSGRAPVVVMLTSRGGSIDKIRGGLAGCDAYLTKPLNEAELLKVLSKYDEQVERSFRDTNLGGSGVSSFKS
jgi:two-component system, cell cycle response regulator